MAFTGRHESQWFESEVGRHYKKFSTKEDIDIFIGTWNVNAKTAKDDITSWIKPPTMKEHSFKPHIYALGFQEIVDLNAANLWIENTANINWEEKIIATLGGKQSEYIQIGSKHLVGILLVIYVHKSIKKYVTNIMTSVCGVGLFGTAGNKGGVGIRFKLFDSEICFICAHLAAHKKNVEGRNSDYMKILENLKFLDKSQIIEENEDESKKPENPELKNPSPDTLDTTTTTSSNNNNTMDEEYYDPISIFDHDMIFWLGDLNYRLNFDDLEQVYTLLNTELSKPEIKDRDYKLLLLKDQLINERRKQHAFGKFNEPQILFQPTYKFQPGTSKYERREDKKKRFPAWCDRILWRKGTLTTTDEKDVKCLLYDISMDQTMSDHKPVYGLIKYKANKFDQNKRREIRKQIMKNKDQNDNKKLPQVQVDPEINFNTIKFGEPEKKKYIIFNSGQVVARYRFTHADSKDSLPKWLKISPINGTILPQQKASISFELNINSSVVKDVMNAKTNNNTSTNNNNKQNISSKKKKISYLLDETILLRIENGIDADDTIKFVMITAEYLPSSFGNKIENLIKYKQPIRYINDFNNLNDNGTILSIPKELWRLVDHVYKYGMVTEQILIRSGISSEISEIRECLDTGKEFGKYDNLSFGEALVRFLESLQDPVFPESILAKLDNKDLNHNNIAVIQQWCRKALMTLPLSHYNVFIYIISFLRNLLEHKQKNKLSAEMLAYQFSSALMHVQIKDVYALKNHKPFKILRHFLSDEFWNK